MDLMRQFRSAGQFFATRSETQKLWILATGAVLIRILAALTTAVVAADGSRYLRMARLMYDHAAFGEALSLNPMHPLYPILIAYGNVLTGDMALAGALISALLGGLAVIPLYGIIRKVWSERVAVLSCVLYLFLPAISTLQGEVMTEGAFMFFFFTAMALSWSALEKQSWTYVALAGMCSALAWLARPEGIYLPLLFLLACTMSPKKFTLGAVPLYLATAVILAFPYLLFIKAHNAGHFGITAHPFSKGVFGLLTGETPPEGYQLSEKGVEEYGEYRYQDRFGRVGGAILYIGQTVAKILFYVFLPFLILGFFCIRAPEGGWRPAIYLLAAAMGYFIPPVLSFVAGTPFGYRYILPPVVLLLPVVILGWLKAIEWSRRPWLLPVVMTVLCGVMTVKTVLPKRTDKLSLKMAGETIREKLGENKRIAGTRREVEYYARGEFFELPPEITFARLEQLIAEKKIDLLALYVRDLRHTPGLQEAVEKKYPLWAEFHSRPDTTVKPVRIYLTPPSRR